MSLNNCLNYLGGGKIMKKVSLVTLFSSLLLVFSVVGGGTHLAFANTAADARSAGTEEAMRAFVVSTKQRWERITDPDGHSEFRVAMRTDDGVWKDGDIYIISVNQKIFLPQILEPGESILFHGGHHGSTDGSLRHIRIFEQLMTEVEQADGNPVCLVDTRATREGRHICAVGVTLSERQSTFDQYLVAGFDHEPEQVDYSKAPCGIEEGWFGQTSTDSNGEEFTRTSADMVTDRESLVDYLKTVDEHITAETKRIQDSLPPGLPLGAQIGYVAQDLLRLRPCWREKDGPWKSGEIYFYLTRYTDKQYGIFNGLNAEFEDVTLHLYDGCIDVG